jgi:hypothetical protein
MVGVSFRYSFRVVPFDVQAGRHVPVASALKMCRDLPWAREIHQWHLIASDASKLNEKHDYVARLR